MTRWHAAAGVAVGASAWGVLEFPWTVRWVYIAAAVALFVMALIVLIDGARTDR